MNTTTTRLPTLGLRAYAAQFVLLVAVKALVGGMVGQQQTVLPLLAKSALAFPGYSLLFTDVDEAIPDLRKRQLPLSRAR